MKRYLLFGYDNYYPSGGQHDVVDSFDSLDELKEFIKDSIYKLDYYDILDMDNRCWIDPYTAKGLR